MQDEEYKVSDFAKLLDLTPETIRYYESVGIINPRHDENNRYRYYLSTDFSRLYNAKLLRSLGFALSDIKSFFYEKDNMAQKDMAVEQANKLKEQVTELQRQIDVLGVFADELGSLDRLKVESDIVESEPFWLVPFRVDYSFNMQEASLEKMKSVYVKQVVPRYSYLMKVAMKPDLPCECRYTGYSVRGEFDRPTDNAIYIPRRKAMRFSYSLIAGERFSVGVKRMDLFGRLRSMGIDAGSVEIYGHTINISTENDVTYLNNMGYIPLEGEPLVDWNSISG
ncbi:MAG: MerR family transcriptional regulator [Firmicutes bacterium]|nr:MerR family transcriptional regulator [Bacillota bacterium]